MANIYKRWLCEESLKTPSSRPILIYFEFRSKPSLITVISMDPRPTNYLRQNIVFSYPEMIRVSFSFFLSFSVFCYFYVVISFYNLFYYYYCYLLLLFFFHENYFLFFHVQECSVFRVLSTPAPSTCIRKFLHQDFFFGRIRLRSTHIR